MRLSEISKRLLDESNIKNSKYKAYIKELRNELRTNYGLSFHTVKGMSDNLVIESFIKIKSK